MQKIILKKEKQVIKLVLVHKHKIKDLIGIRKGNQEFIIDVYKLQKYTKGGVLFSQSSFKLIYKLLSQKQLRY